MSKKNSTRTKPVNTGTKPVNTRTTEFNRRRFMLRCPRSGKGTANKK